jgi:hypothetical protein
MESSKPKQKPGLITFFCLFFEKLKFAFLLFVLTSICLFPAFSQYQADISTNYENPDEYIIQYDTVLNVRINVNSEFDFFEVNGDGFHYDIRPNIKIRNELAVSYRNINLHFGFTPKFIPGNRESDKKGKTSLFSFRFQFFQKHLIQEIEFAKTSGFYLHNTSDFVSNWDEKEDPYIQFPDLIVNTIMGATGYKFNPNFSMKAISLQNERQLKSCGSVVTFLDYDWFKIDNKSEDPSQLTSQRTNNFVVTGSLGYMYTFVLGSKFYTSLGVLPGAGFQYTNLLTRTENGETVTKYTDPVFRISEKAGVGYSNNKFFTGAEISLSQAFHKQNSTTVQTKALKSYLQVYFGYRFNAPRFLKKETDAIEKNKPKIFKKK